MRIYANYSKDEYDLIIKKSSEIGFSPSAYVKYMSLLTISKRNDIKTIQTLHQEMQNSLILLKQGETFIVSTLISTWTTLTRSTKMNMSKKLKTIVENNPNSYKFVKKLPGKINQYQKI